MTLEAAKWTCPTSHGKSVQGNRAAVSLQSANASAPTAPVPNSLGQGVQSLVVPSDPL